jgi:catechol 2,3-dioxygenase-like lactoylglutathione lyase family enzyme
MTNGGNPAMMKFDHLSIPVTDGIRSRDWYVSTLGLEVEFEVPERRTVALKDTDGFAIFLQETTSPVTTNGCALWFQVADVDATFADRSAQGVAFSHGPRQSFWGYGAELADPDGYLIRLWDERSMQQKKCGAQRPTILRLCRLARGDASAGRSSGNSGA